jgi:septum formation protein
MSKLILASQSPRRKELLKQLGYNFEVLSVPTDEQFNPHLSIEAALIEVARHKAKVINAQNDEVIISADTIVILNHQILGKPRDLNEAKWMLRALSNQTHRVLTALVVRQGQVEQAHVCETLVRFNDLSDELIEAYVMSGLAMDKAGAYGIQDGYPLVHSIEGEYENVMGLPIQKLKEVLSNFGC